MPGTEGALQLSSPEKDGNPIITVVFGNHITSRDSPMDPTTGKPRRSIWLPETQQMVARISPGPAYVAVDSLTGNTALAQLFFPSDDYNHFAPAGTTVHLVGADVPQVEAKPWDSIIAKQTWDKIRRDLESVDALFASDVDSNILIDQQILREYAGESVPAGIVGATGAVLLRLLQSDVQPASSVASGQPKHMTNMRREFLKMLLAAGGGVAISALRMPLFYKIGLRPESVSNADSLIERIASVMKPIVFGSVSLDLRNAKIGLATIECLQHEPSPGATAAIVLGTFHKVEIFPGQRSGESLEAARHRLFSDMKSKLLSITREIYACDPSVDLGIVRAVLKTLFAEYAVFDFPQSERLRQTETLYSWATHELIDVSRFIDKLTLR